jgi:hypothetical protein
VRLKGGVLIRVKKDMVWYMAKCVEAYGVSFWLALLCKVCVVIP